VAKLKKMEWRKVCDWIGETVQHNVHVLKSTSCIPDSINVIENDGKRYIALDDVYKLLDDQFETHRFS